MPKLPFVISVEGLRWFLAFLLLACILIPFSVLLASFALTGGVLAALFFRIPCREIPQEEGLILSPADGRVLTVDEVEEPLFMKGRCRRVSIFLSVFDVHMNYAPVGGIIDWVAYRKGKFRMAFVPKASEDNENQCIGISSPWGKILVRQIAGTVARRIVLFKKAADEIQRGERIGMIKFGSRVEIYLPQHLCLEVSVGDRVAGGRTVLAVVS